MRTLLYALIDIHLENPKFYRVLDEEVPRPAGINELRRRGYAEQTRAMAEILRQRPDVIVADCEIAAQIIALALDAISHRVSHQALCESEREAFVSEAVKLVVRYLCPPDSWP